MEAAVKPKTAISCCIRNDVKPTDESSRFDLKQLWKRGALRSCRLYMAPDAGVYEVDLHAKCQEKSRIKTYDVSKYLVKNDCAASGLPRQHPGRRWKLSTKCHLCICQQW